MRFRLSLTVILLIFVAAGSAAAIDLTHEKTFSFNQVHGQIDTAIFVDLLGSSDPEVVLLDDSGVQVYSLMPQSLLAERPLIGGTRSLAVADMNGDGKRDIVALRTANYWTIGAIDLILLDNALGFARVDSATFADSTGIFTYHPRPPLLQAIDVDCDSALEVVFSYDQRAFSWLSLSDYFIGSTVFFDEFATLRDAGLGLPIRDAAQFELPGGDRCVLMDRRSMWTWDFQVSKGAWLDSHIDQWYSVDSAATLLSDPALHTLSCDASVHHNPVESSADRKMRTWGQVTGDTATVEIVSTLNHFETCEYYDGAFDTTYLEMADYLSLHRFTPGKPLQEFWTLDITGQEWQAFRYLPQFPGYFFAIVDGYFSQFRGDDGSLFQSSSTVPDGKLYWAKPFTDSLDRLIALEAKSVSLYRFDIVTAIDDDATGLPGSFALGDPYPNPFNPSVSFSITLAAKSVLTVGVFNALGQEVAQIYSGELPAGERTFVWDGAKQASGVYFIKASTTEATLTKKAVLVK